MSNIHKSKMFALFYKLTEIWPLIINFSSATKLSSTYLNWIFLYICTVKLGDKELLDSERPGASKIFCGDQKVITFITKFDCIVW